VNIAKDHRLEGMTFWQKELKEIRGKDAMAIMVTAPGTVDDVDTTELVSLKITSRSFPMVIQTPFTMMKAIIYLRRQQKVK
jgi:hypothetical protein